MAPRPPASRLAFVVPAAFALLVSLLGQWWSPQAFDTDEGINLGKGALVAAGYHPYADIWNDQPPVLTYVLAAVQTIAPWNLGAARVAILLFACLLLYSAFRLVERSAGRPAAVTTVLLLGTAAIVWRLSISVMVGLPAIALAMTACAVAYRRDRAGLIRTAAAGIVFALSLQTKLFTAAALPAFLAMAYLSGDERGRRERIWQLAVAVAATALGFVAIAWLAGEPVLLQLVEPHVDHDVRSDYSFLETMSRLADSLIQQPFVLFSAGLAAVPAFRATSPLRWAWLIWIGGALVVLLGHTPIWYHHALLLVVPMACLGGESLWRLVEAAWPRRRAFARHRIVLAIALPVVALAYLMLILRPFHFASPVMSEGAKRLARYADGDPWVATDQPFGAFRARLLVPPEIIVFSRKRIEAHNLTSQTLLDVIVARRPGQVLLRRQHADQAVVDYLDRNYVSVGKSDVHYVRRDIAE